MAGDQSFDIVVLPGDGIGLEVVPAALALLEKAVARAGGFDLRFQTLRAGAALYEESGTALPDEVVTRAGAADAVLLGAMGDPAIRYPDGREIAPQIDLREIFGLFAGVRPVRTFPGLPVPLADPRAATLDFVLIREQTEGLFFGRNAINRTADEATDTLKLTRAASARLFDFAFALATRRKARGQGPGRVTCVDKANVLGSFAFFRDVFAARAAAYPDIAAEGAYVDAVALNFVRNPWRYDVLATENMFGDILSDLGAGLMGGLGFAPSADIGEKHAVFQPCHGTAPDIAGKGLANPTATILSAAMMLDWLGEKFAHQACHDAASILDQAVVAAFADGSLRPAETGGPDGLRAITDAVAARI